MREEVEHGPYLFSKQGSACGTLLIFQEYFHDDDARPTYSDG